MKKYLFLLILCSVALISNGQTVINLADQCNCEVKKPGTVVMPGDTANAGTNQGDLLVDANGTIFHWNGSSWQPTMSTGGLIDQDSTNELQTLSISNDTLYLSNGNSVYLGAISSDNDKDSTNELQVLSISNDTLYLSNGNSVYLGPISSDNDQDSTNESNQTFVINGTNLEITDNNGTLSVPLTSLQIDTTSLSARIDTNAANIAAHIANDLDIDSTNESNQTFVINGTNLEITDNNGTLTVPLTSIQIDTTSLSNRIDANSDSIDAVANNLATHVANDLDIDSTNESNQTFVINGTNLEITDNNGTLSVPLTSLQIDTTSLSARIDTNAANIAAHIANDLDIDSTNESNQTFVINGTNLEITDNNGTLTVPLTSIQIDTTSLSNRIDANSDSIDVVANNLATHISNDLDIDSTNESNQTFVINGTNLEITDNNGTLSLPLTSLQIDTTSLSARIDTNAANIAAHIANDLDIDSTNESNQTFVINGTNLEITDNNGTLTVPLTSIQIDTTSLSNRIDANSDSIDVVATNLATHITNDLDIDSTNESNQTFVINGTNLEITDNNGTLSVPLTSLQIDTTSLSARIDTNAANIAAHIANDLDIDSTNESNQTFVINGTNLEITDNNGTLTVPLTSIQIDTTSLSNRIDANSDSIDAVANNLATHVANDLDIDSTNESNQTFVINGTNLEITDNNGTLSLPLTSLQIDTTSLSARIDTNAANIAAHIANDLDIDSTNESNQTFVINGTNLEITDNNGTLTVPLTSIQIDTTSLSNRIDANSDSIDAVANNLATHITNDLDIDSTNESNQTFVINGTNLEITDNNGTLSVPLTSLQIDTTSLSARIDTNAANIAAHIANDLDIDSTNESNQTFVINGTNLEITDNNGTLTVPLTSIQIDTTSLSNRIDANSDSIDAVANNLATHVANDLDIDSTNESNQTFVINGTNLEITDNNGTLSVPLTSLQIDTTSLSARIDTNAANIAAHIANDLDIDSTNESNQTFVINGTNLEITDNNGTLTVPLTSIQIDTTSLSNRIDANSDSIDAVANNLATHITNDLDIDSTNESNQTFVINGTNLEITDNNGTLSVPLTSLQIDTTSLSARIDTNAANIAAHIANDLDIDSTNESNQTFVINGTNLEITDNNGTLTVPLTSIQIDTTSLSNRIDANSDSIDAVANNLATHVANDLDIDSTNESNQTFVINGTNLEITDNNGTLSVPLTSLQIDTTSLSARIDTNAANIAAHIANDLDIDSTNESNQTFVINGTNLEITDNNGTLTVPLTSIQIDTTSLSNRIDANSDSIDAVANNLATHITNDLDIDSTNESNQTFVINGTNLEITDNNGTLSVPLTSLQIDTTSLSARIDTNAANIAAHIANDLDIDSTNESNQTFVINGTNLEITDNNGTLTVPLTSIQIDTTSLSNRIDANSDSIDAVANNLATHITNDLDIDSTNESNQTFVINGTNLEITDNNGTLSVPLTSLQIDTTSLSARIDTNAANIAAHIANDLDIDSTNESNQTFVINGTNLEITDNNGTLTVPLTSIQIDTTSLSNRIDANSDSIDAVATNLATHITNDLDIDSTNESNQTFVINGTHLEITDNNGTLSVPLTSLQIDTTSLSARIDTNAANIAAHIANDLDIDSTNESNQTFVINGTNLEITDNNGTLTVPLTSIQIDTTSLSNRIDANSDSIDAVANNLATHVANDLDIDSTNESNQTFVINGTNLEITDNNGTLSVPLTSLQIDTTSLSARIDTNAANIAAHIANDLDIDSTNESNQTFVINGTNLEITDNNGTLTVPLTSIQIDTTSLSNRIDANSDSIDAVANNLATHVANDLDIDSTNESNQTFVINGTNLEITDNNGTLSVPLTSLQIDTTSLSARIDTNAANIAAHIANDLDIDSTNESNQTFVINGTNLEITDNNGTLSVPLTSIQIDTTSLSNRIDANSDSIDAVANNLATHVANDLDIDSTNESNQTFVINGTNLEITDNNGTLSVPLTSLQIDTTSLSARIDTNAANIAAHIANDLDIDSTNESNQTFVINGTNLEITDNNGTLTVPLTSIQIDTTSLSNRIDANSDSIDAVANNLATHISNDLDIDSTNESNQTFVINGTNLEITDNNGTLSVPLTSLQIDTTSLSARIDTNAANIAAHIANDLDIDSTNESNQTFVINGTNLEITDNNGTLTVPLTSIQIDTTSLSNRIDANSDSIDAVANNLATHVANDLDIDSTNESNQTFVINGTNLEITDNNGTLSVPLTSLQIDTTSLSARIDTNAANIAAHIANDLDIDSTNESNQTFVINGTNLEITDNNGTLTVPLTSIQIDTTSLSNRIDANSDSIDVVANNLATHVANDLDIDSTNELITSVTYTNDSLIITEAGTTFTTYIPGEDSLNERISSITFANDTLTVVENDSTFKSEIIAGNWPDASRISNTGFHYAKNAMDNGDTVVVTDNGLFGVGVSVPTEKIDVDGTLRLRDVDTATIAQDTVLIIGSDGVVKKRALQFCDSVKTFIEVTNTVSGNINAAAGGTVFSWINPAAGIIQNAPGAYTVANTGITVNKTGIYKVTVYQYQQVTNTGVRNNAALRIRVNGVVQSVYGANAYQRVASGHNESTASISKLLSLNAGDIVSLRNDRIAGVGNVICPVGTLVFMLEEK